MQENQITAIDIKDTVHVGEFDILYVNSASIRISPYDFMLQLSQNWDVDEETGTVASKALALVMMSPQHAKAFSEILAKNIRAFESVFGPIQVGRIEGANLEQPAASAPQRRSSRSRAAARKKGS